MRARNANGHMECKAHLPHQTATLSAELARHDAWRTAISEQIWHTQACVRAMRHKSMKCTHRVGACTQRSSDDSAYLQTRSMPAPYAMRASHLRTKATPRIAILAKVLVRHRLTATCPSVAARCSCYVFVSALACPSIGSSPRRARGCDRRTRHGRAHGARRESREVLCDVMRCHDCTAVRAALDFL